MTAGLGKELFRKKILSWYNQHKRNLPWRATKDPYKIWVSEIILQQTRVAQGLPYYERFIEKFPTVHALAKANEHEVLRLWQGLGYYSRARNMHRCAKTIVNEWRGVFPNSFEELLALPGVGPYTAAAIGSIAFNLPVAVVDGNVFRVLARVYGIDADIASNEGKKMFAVKANELVAADAPGEFNQALMEFGATHCAPQNPGCDTCIFKAACVAIATDRVGLLPVKEKKMKVKNRYFNYFVFVKGANVGMRQRAANDIWQGLYDFFLVETPRAVKPEKIVVADFGLKAFAGGTLIHSEKIKHLLSHQKLHINFLLVKIEKATLPGIEFYNSIELASLPKPIVITRFLEKNGFVGSE